MSLDVTGLTAWTDENKFDLIKRSVIGNRTAQILAIVSGIKETATVNYMDSAVTFGADGCGRTPTDSTPLTQTTVTVGDIIVSEDLCPKDLKSYYAQKFLNAGSMGEDEVDFAQMYTEHKAQLISYELEKADWSGDTLGAANLAFYDGLIKLVDAGTPVDGNPTGITAITGISSTNAVGILLGMYELAPERILDKEDLTIFIGFDHYRAYELGLRAENMFHAPVDGAVGEIMLYGAPNVTIKAVQGLTGTDRIFLTRESNFFIATDLQGEEEDFSMRWSEDDRIVKFDSAFKRGTGVYFTEEVVEFTLV